MIEVLPATPDRWPAVAELFRASRSECWCQYWRLSASEYGRGPRERVLAARPAQLREQIEAGPPPGVIAFVDGVPAGWCGLWPRARFERLVRSRTIPPVDPAAAWSIVCFLVRVGYRRQGAGRALLEGAIGVARRAGAPALEAYPVDPEGSRIDGTFAYVGLTSTFEAAGFRRVLETNARSAGRSRWLMRLDLDAEPARRLNAAPVTRPAARPRRTAGRE